MHSRNTAISTKFLKTSIALGIVMAISAPSAVAQSEGNDLEIIEVKGFVQGLEQAKTIKRENTQFVDAVMAEDIGKLPDLNVAESLQRVSGVQLDRGIGEGTSVSIRGFRNNVILVNGREMIDGGGRGSTGPDTLDTTTYSLLALLPSEMISRLEVTKQAGADEIEGSIGGVVNIITRKPLSKKGLQASGSASVSYGELSGNTNYKGSFLVSNTFADDTFGLMLGANIDDREAREDGFNTFSGYSRLTQGGPFNFLDIDAPNAATDPNGNLLNPDPNGDGVNGLIHQEPRVWQIDDARDRTGVNFVAQWRPSEDLEFSFDLISSELKSDRERRWIGTFIPFARLKNAVLNENEVLVSGTSVREAQTNVEFNDSSSEVLSQALSMDWTLSGTLNMSAELAYTQAETYLHQTFARLLGNEKTEIDFDFRPEVPVLSFDASALNDLSQLNLFQFNDNKTRNDADHTALRIDFDQDLSDDYSIEYGVRLSQIDTSLTELQRATIRPRTPGEQLTQFVETWSSPDFFSGELAGLPRHYLAFSKQAYGAGGCTVFRDFFLNHPDPAQTAAFTNGLNGQSCTNNDHLDAPAIVEEDFQSAYVKLNFFGDLSGIEYTGNVGLRYIDRSLKSIGTQLNADSSKTKIVTESDSREVLPSATVKFDLSDDLVARVGAAKVLAYPNNADLRNRLSITGDGTGSAGSPDLKPFKANQLDLSLEYYIEDGLLSAGYFRKSIDSFVVSSTDFQSIPGYVHPENGSDQALIRRNINGDGGSVNGLELIYQQTYSSLPAPFDGLGTSATYSYIDSETPFIDIEGNALPLPGLSKNNINFVAFWEKGPFGVRLAYNWRDEYLDRLGFSGSGVFSDDYKDLSLTTRWDISDKMSLDFQATNLLDSRQRLFNTYQEATRSIVEYGPSYILSFRVSL
ncbi:TonB-dependent receptor [Paraglaciecola arctica]|uniref:TonB-dependent receptor n=1 Tax=Paraglaciecola arctica TaxID=1128911 RepID=UPI001C0737CE|nr:TonB-dependent receptor [Paraglaciecola arctica]MBU3005265.1 TonB-dependent receptor [Paraglaciecola arctica]